MNVTQADLQEAERRARARIIHTELDQVIAEREAREAQERAEADRQAQAEAQRREEARALAASQVETCKSRHADALTALDKLAAVLEGFEADYSAMIRAGNIAANALRQAYGLNADAEAARIGLTGHATLALPIVEMTEPSRYAARQVLARIIERGGLY
jgi:hypothetical protein